MNKVAFMTMDVESFYDTSCIQRSKMEIDEQYDCASEIERFINFLDERNIKATFFLAVSFLPRCKDILLKAIENGHEVALHCLAHEKVKNESVEEFEANIKKAKQIIKDELGIEIKGFRFPCFKYKQEYMDVIKKNDFVFDSSDVGSKKPLSKVINNVVSCDNGFYEFAPAGANFINLSGGGYLRLLPGNFYKKKIIKYFKNNNAYLLYLHPFEIYEGEFPKLKGVNFIEKMYVNRGRDTYLKRIEEIINLLKEENYEFYTMSDYIKENKL